MFRIVRILLTTQKYAKSFQLCHLSNLNPLVHKINVNVESTLTNRLLFYLNKDSSLKVKQQHEDEGVILDLLKHKNQKEFEKYDSQTLLSSFIYLIEHHTITNSTNILKLVEIFESECCQRLKNLTNKQIFSCLWIFMKFVPHKIVRLRFFELSLKHLMDQRVLQHRELMQLIFFIGVMKKNKNASVMLRKCIEIFDSDFIDNLTSEEICIICSSTFRTATKIKNQLFLDKILKYLSDNLYLLKDPAIFVTMLKTLRHNRYQNEDLLATISCAMFFNKTLDYYSFPALCHILALYSDYLYYDEAFLNICAKKCVELLKDSKYISETAYLLQQPRLKDIKRLLWCLSNLNCKHLSNCDIENVIIPQIMIRINAGEGKRDPLSLIEMSLYLWMMNYKAYELIEYCWSEEILRLLKVDPLGSKTQLNLLASCIFYEDKKLYRKLSIRPFQDNYNMNFQLQKRPLLSKIMNILKPISKKYDISRFEMNCQVPGLNIIGITGYRKQIYKVVNIEILDEYTVLKNTQNMPTGLMQLKLRLLEKLDEALIVIDSEEVDCLSNAELQDLLSDEINFVC